MLEGGAAVENKAVATVCIFCADLATAFGQAHRLERLAAAEGEGADRFDGVGDVDRLEGGAVRQEAAVDRRRVVRDRDALEGGGGEGANITFCMGPIYDVKSIGDCDCFE